MSDLCLFLEKEMREGRAAQTEDETKGSADMRRRRCARNVMSAGDWLQLQPFTQSVTHTAPAITISDVFGG